MSRPTDEERITQFIQLLTEKGGSAGNYAMMNALAVSEAEYWRIRDKVLDTGEITRGRGQGGSVILVRRPAPSVQPATESNASLGPSEGESTNDAYKDEKSLYEPCLATLKTNWSMVNRLFAFEAQVTASQGGRKTGGIWTRPDITGISLRTFPYWPGRHFDLWTFEIKPRGEFNVLGLFEALSHARSATHSWALYHVDKAMVNADENPDLERMTSEAQRLGIGFITFSDPKDFSTWTIQVDSVRQSPDPSLHDELVKTQLSTEIRETLQHWAR